ncbi:hypothetical protein BH24PSE2_BH24PSE2_04920 [soil metagenome]
MYEPILSRRLLAEIFDLNRGFLQLVRQGAGPDGRGGTNWGLEPALLTRIGRFPSRAVDDLCGCPFLLFGLRFDDLEFWSHVRESRACYRYGAPADSGVAIEHDRHAFTLLALFYAWHLASTNPAAARLCCGLPPAAARIYRSLPMSELLRVAVQAPALLHAQFEDKPKFWAELLEIIENGDRRRLGAARVAGTHLIGTRCATRAGRIRGIVMNHRRSRGPA